MQAICGAEAVLGVYRRNGRRLDFEELKLRAFIAQGEKVVVDDFERFRSKATGHAVDNDYIHLYAVRDGKIKVMRVFEENAPILTAMRSA